VNFNKYMCIANLTREPSLRYTASGTAICDFGVAMNKKFKSGDEWKEEVCFVDITAWGNLAEACAEALDKGQSVFIEGELKFDTWEKDGQKHSKHSVTAKTVIFLSERGNAKEAKVP